MEKITLPSGAELQISLLPFEEAWDVCQTVTKVLEGLNINFNDLEISKPSDMFQLKTPLMQLLSNKQIIEAARICFKRSLYNNIKIDMGTFETPSARGDFLFVCWYCLYHNIAPFFSNLISFLNQKLTTILPTHIQK